MKVPFLFLFILIFMVGSKQVLPQTSGNHNTARSNFTPPLQNTEKDQVVCKCRITEMKVGNTVVQNSTNPNNPAIVFDSGLFPVNGTQLSIDGNCNPCESSFAWEIINPKGLSTSLQGSIINYQFNIKGIYTCIAHQTCLNNDGTVNSSCDQQFFIQVKDKLQTIEKPVGISEPPVIHTKKGKIEEPASKTEKNGGKYVTSADHFAFSQGEPVPGAELFLEQEPDEEPIMAAATGDNGLIVISGIKQGDFSLSMKFPIKKEGKKSSSSKPGSGLTNSTTTDISSLKKIKSYLLSCPDGEYNLVVLGDDALSESNIEPKFDVTYNNKTNEYDIKVVSFKSAHNKGSVTSTVAFSFYAVPKNSFIPKQGTTTPPVITNPTAVKQESAFAEPDKIGVSGAEVILTQIEARQNSGKNGDKLLSSVDHFALDKGNFDPSKINAVNKVKTNKEGDYKFEKPQTLDNGEKNSDMMNYFILNIPMQFFRDIGPSKGKGRTVSGKFNFNLETQTSKGVMNQFIVLDLYNPNDPRADVWTNYCGASSGPYSQCASNLEDNICVPIPIGIDATDILSGKLYYSTANQYGIHDVKDK